MSGAEFQPQTLWLLSPLEGAGFSFSSLRTLDISWCFWRAWWLLGIDEAMYSEWKPSCWTRTTSPWEVHWHPHKPSCHSQLSGLWWWWAALRPGSVSKRTTSNCIWPHPGKRQLRNWRQESPGLNSLVVGAWVCGYQESRRWLVVCLRITGKATALINRTSSKDGYASYWAVLYCGSHLAHVAFEHSNKC